MTGASPDRQITVYWRPGCGFCVALLARLERSSLDYRTVNIWDDDDARAFVRSVADGHETVPTVTVGDEAFVNPPFEVVRRAVGRLSDGPGGS